VKRYVAAVWRLIEALRKKERQDETQFKPQFSKELGFHKSNARELNPSSQKNSTHCRASCLPQPHLKKGGFVSKRVDEFITWMKSSPTFSSNVPN
jgi:hypothetical protein